MSVAVENAQANDDGCLVSTNRTSPKGTWVAAGKLPKGPNGRALCRNRGTEVPKGRRTFCGDRRVDDWAVRHNPAQLRQRVFRRDKGVCALRGVDTAVLGKVLHAE